MGDSPKAHEPWTLLYWPGIPGRGEFVRLVLEHNKIPYKEPARFPEANPAAVMTHMQGKDAGLFPGASPPFLLSGPDNGKAVSVSQSMNIVCFLSEVYGLGPQDAAGKFAANAVLYTVADVVAETHDTHHPLSTQLYYEDQKEAAAKKAENFRTARIPKYLGYFERVLAFNADNSTEEHSAPAVCFGKTVGPADLAIWHTLEGLAYAFPKAFAKHCTVEKFPLVTRLRSCVGREPAIVDYLASDRHQDFNANGIFRAYGELDDSE
jgi:glutathione S-transferase